MCDFFWPFRDPPEPTDAKVRLIQMKISIFGAGYVGVVSSGCLAALGHEVIAVDVAPEKIAMLRRGQSPIVEAEINELVASGVQDGRLVATDDVEEAVARTDVSFISVGTPSAPNGSVSMTAVDNVVSAIGRALKGKAARHTVVMRSTVPPGTAEDRVIPMLERESGRRHGVDFAYYSNPEFLREGSSVRDFHAPPFTLIGAAPGDDAAVLRNLYAAIEAPVHVAPYRVVESAKYLSNAYHAVKLAFANEAGQILAAHGVDAREAFRIFREDRVLNISSAYLRPGFAFGGSCLPKDIRSLLALANDKDVAAPFLRHVLPSNQDIVERTYGMIARHGRQKVALLGLAFKQGTDDLRESPFVVLAEKLLGKGYDLRIFDRSVQVARLVGSNRVYIDREIPHIERLMVDDVAVALAESRIVVVGHVGAEDRAPLCKSLSDHIVFDLAGIDELAAQSGIVYQGICW
ncbi:MAG: UDP-glucose/GDP-mannose dehydrogenase family protein [Rhodospirillales bacterium]|nr:UDP-glucose/GDP-mannose dehydrogenase family protein [Rhodospirillales bacterium]